MPGAEMAHWNALMLHRGVCRSSFWGLARSVVCHATARASWFVGWPAVAWGSAYIGVCTNAFCRHCFCSPSSQLVQALLCFFSSVPHCCFLRVSLITRGLPGLRATKYPSFLGALPLLPCGTSANRCTAAGAPPLLSRTLYLQYSGLMTDAPTATGVPLRDALWQVTPAPSTATGTTRRSQIRTVLWDD